ncbi:MAG: serine hydrolase [Clostridia bacterium]|nr:serine hydrolase [Clostridia bacterium]
MKELPVLEAIKHEMAHIPGHLGFYYKNLISGFCYGVNEEEVFGAASVMKLPLYLLILQKSLRGEASMEDKITVTQGDKVPICGALTLFTHDIETDVRTLCRLMISLSDNTATNRLIDHIGIPEIQKQFASMGLEKTMIRRKLFDRAAARAGIQNTICPREMGDLLEKLYRREILSPALCKEAVETLLLQQVDHKLNGKICGEVPIAHKTGEDDNLSNDVGIVYAGEPFVICFVGHDTNVYLWEDLMRRSTYDLLKIQE